MTENKEGFEERISLFLPLTKPKSKVIEVT
jgi:hypothetical protein